jgi:predicted peptidase
MPQEALRSEFRIAKNVGLDFLLYLPPNYNVEAGKRWPFILFLHGSGERGANLELVKLYGLPKKLAQGEDLPFIIASPQCPADSYWYLHVDELKALVEDLTERYAVDRRRVYLSGLSMGGAGTWLLAAAYPELFAAINPICGRAIPAMANRLKDMPIWVFHGEEDTAVPVGESRRMADALREVNNNVMLTIYPGVDHDSWTQTYDNPALYAWFLEHSR